jgi:hypothetical protein
LTESVNSLNLQLIDERSRAATALIAWTEFNDEFSAFKLNVDAQKETIRMEYKAQLDQKFWEIEDLQHQLQVQLASASACSVEYEGLDANYVALKLEHSNLSMQLESASASSQE